MKAEVVQTLECCVEHHRNDVIRSPLIALFAWIWQLPGPICVVRLKQIAKKRRRFRIYWWVQIESELNLLGESTKEGF